MKYIVRDKIYISQASENGGSTPSLSENSLKMKLHKGRIEYISIYWKREHQDVKLDFVNVLTDQRGTKKQLIPIGSDFSGGTLIINGYNADPNTYHEIWIDLLLDVN